MLLSKKYAHLEALVSKHVDLEGQLLEGYRTYADDLAMQSLKRHKIEVKEEIEQLRLEIAEYIDRKA